MSEDTARERYEDIAHELAATHSDVELRKLFSMPAIYVKGKACAGFTQASRRGRRWSSR